MKRGLAKTGFSMVEVLVAVGILAILSIGLFFVTGQARKQAERALVESTLVTLDTALQQYYDDQKYISARMPIPDLSLVGPGLAISAGAA